MYRKANSLYQNVVVLHKSGQKITETTKKVLGIVIAQEEMQYSKTHVLKRISYFRAEPKQPFH